MPEPIEVQMPSGQVIRVRPADGEDAPQNRARDVSLTESALQLLAVPDFIPTVDAVLTTVRTAVTPSRPDTVTVEFGIELNAKTGRAISILTEAGGKAHVKITATWGRDTIGPTTVEVQETEQRAEEPGNAADSPS